VIPVLVQNLDSQRQQTPVYTEHVLRRPTNHRRRLGFDLEACSVQLDHSGCISGPSGETSPGAVYRTRYDSRAAACHPDPVEYPAGLLLHRQPVLGSRDRLPALSPLERPLPGSTSRLGLSRLSHWNCSLGLQRLIMLAAPS